MKTLSIGLLMLVSMSAFAEEAKCISELRKVRDGIQTHDEYLSFAVKQLTLDSTYVGSIADARAIGINYSVNALETSEKNMLWTANNLSKDQRENTDVISNDMNLLEDCLLQ